MAERQWGVLSLAQLRRCGYSRTAVCRLVARGYLIRLYPAVFAVGHVPQRVEGRLAAALFHAGPGSALSHTTAAWWWRMIETAPTVIHIATTHRPARARGVVLHRRRAVERGFERRLPVTPPSRTLLDLAAVVNERTLRGALAQADHRRQLDPVAVTAQIRPGHRGGTALRRAIHQHLPELADTDSELEVAFLLLVERAGVPVPRVQARVEGLRVDALWAEQRLIVELDGHATHANPAANEEDRRRELILRRAGYRVVRYTWQQVHQRPREVVADLVRELGVRQPAAGNVG